MAQSQGKGIASRKLWVVVAGLVAEILVAVLGLDPEVAKSIGLAIAAIIGTYVIGQGYADGQAARQGRS